MQHKVAENVLTNLAALAVPQNLAFKQLLDNPRLPGNDLNLQDVLWPLHVLSLPHGRTLDEVSMRISWLIPQIDPTISPAKTMIGMLDDLIHKVAATEYKPWHSMSAVERATVNLVVAYLFLRWPQNRERIARALLIAPELAPNTDPNVSGKAP